MQQHGSKYFARRPLLTRLLRSKGQNSTFPEHGHVAYQIKEKHECSNRVADILPADPSRPPFPAVGIKRLKFNFSEHCHVAYQIKENHKCSNRVANILPADPLPGPPSPTLGMGSKLIFFRTCSCCISNNRVHECGNMVAIFCPQTPSPSDLRGQKVNIQLFQKWSCCISN